MARESKKTRDEKRFGKTERLADMIADKTTRWGLPEWSEDGDENVKMATNYTQGIARAIVHAATVVDATNVAEFFCTQVMKEVLEFRDDFHCYALPFDPVFIEMRRPSYIQCGGIVQSSQTTPERWGWLFHVMPQGVAPVPYDKIPSESTKWVIRGHLVAKGCIITSSTGVMNIPASCMLCVGSDGRLLDYVRWIIARPRPNIPEDFIAKVQNNVIFLAMNAFMALSFMGCKNVAVDPAEPDRKLNRVRANAGLKPFVRYHTINIEPMRKVLRTEGGIETNGLKKALHICRGHFRRYTEEKPLFGHTSGLVWTPSHTRGSLKEGVVVSDYKVSPPAPPPDLD